MSDLWHWLWHTGYGLTWLHWRIVVGMAILGSATIVLTVLSVVVANRRDDAKNREAEEQRKSETSQLNAQLQSASAEAERLRIELNSGLKQVAELENKLKPREITPEQRRMLVSALSAFAGQEILVSVLLPVAENDSFAGQLESVLREAGWNPSVGALMTPDMVVGVEVQVGHLRNHPPAASALVAALRAAGIAVGTKIASGHAPNWIRLVVGKKP